MLVLLASSGPEYVGGLRRQESANCTGEFSTEESWREEREYAAGCRAREQDKLLHSARETLNKTRQETEIKLELPDAATGRKLLREAGFRVAVPRSFESNVIFDTPDSRLRSDGMLLRLRSFRGAVTLTLKGRSHSAVYKSRPETETNVSSKEAIAIILEGLGLSPQFVYEKYRTQYQGGRRLGVVLLDETPIGVFFEIEGSPRSIDAAAKALNFSKKDYIVSSYGGLFRNYCELRNIAPGGMVFPPRKRPKPLVSSTRKKLP